jgi:hypothetical protein
MEADIEVTAAKRVLADAAKYLNEAKTPEERNARKAYLHSLLYGCTQTFAEFIKCKEPKN